MHLKIAESWKNILQKEVDKAYFTVLMDFVKLEFKKYRCYPNETAIFAAFDFCSFQDLKVVIIGQDPYHSESHQKKGWETFTDEVIKMISEEKENVVFLLWGKFAESKMNLINKHNHKIFTAPHPSPLGAWRGWFGCKHFSKTNNFLKKIGEQPIQW
jgi:uracil DNA glycosylase